MYAGKFQKSLLVSVADYMPGENGHDIDLNGPTNDSKDMALAIAEGKQAERKRFLRFLFRFFRKRKKEGDHVRLTDNDATKEAVLKAFAKLCASISPGAVGLFYYSGHGTQLDDLTGTEVDGKTECLCPYDTLAGQLITDDEIKAAIGVNLRPGAKLMMVIDCCHSGGQARTIERTRGIDVVAAPKTFYYDGRLPEDVLVWAACAPGELAWERVYDGKPRGAFTHAILPFIRLIAQGATVDLTHAHTEVSKLLATPGVPNSRGAQTPHMETRGRASSFFSD